MKKVGILTFHRSHNCGSILQAYALQEVVKEHGFKPEFIDFSTTGQRELYQVFRSIKFSNVKQLAKSIYKNIFGILLYTRSKQNWLCYEDYISRHLSLSSKTYTENSEISEEDFDYERYIVGSDQVWNVTIDDYNDAYLLNFVHI
jgi:hypothetical protein